MNRQSLEPTFIAQARLRLLRMHHEAGVGHIGGNLSVLDIMLCLYHEVMGDDDAFILSKGHAAGALYTTLWTLGVISEAELQTFHKDNTRLSGHPPCSGIEQVLFATGSLGHGLGLAAGLALAKKLQHKPGHVYCLTSDGEWNEGSCWESLIFARHHNLKLTIVIDVNGLQGFGSTKEIADLEPLGEKFRAFGYHVDSVDGHDIAALRAVFARKVDQPRVILAKTRKGCGVSFMEDRMEWHYLPLDANQYATAVAEVQRCAGSSSSSRAEEGTQ